MSNKYDSEKGKEIWNAVTSGNKSRKAKTSIKVIFPPSEGLKLFDIAEISAPEGMSAVFRIPFPVSEASIAKVRGPIEKIGGSVEVL